MSPAPIILCRSLPSRDADDRRGWRPGEIVGQAQLSHGTGGDEQVFGGGFYFILVLAPSRSPVSCCCGLSTVQMLPRAARAAVTLVRIRIRDCRSRTTLQTVFAAPYVGTVLYQVANAGRARLLHISSGQLTNLQL